VVRMSGRVAVPSVTINCRMSSLVILISFSYCTWLCLQNPSGQTEHLRAIGIAHECKMASGVHKEREHAEALNTTRS
jgi:hypothetical protein